MTRWRPAAAKTTPYITTEGYRALEREVATLRSRRTDTVKHLAAAAAEGDRSENAEYIYRKKELREIDRRLGYLQRRMPTLTVVVRAPEVTDRIFFGACVTLENGAGERSEYRIVGGDEIDRHSSYISIDSPMAQALMKRIVDDEIVVRTVTGEMHYTVIDIRYPTATSLRSP
ncbi:MAG: transcription elongation factor GreB [Gammaproteobacteria bacterium]|nr:transcription elongation factor GreB [Gammaproteobacteria bacterium]